MIITLTPIQEGILYNYLMSDCQLDLQLGPTGSENKELYKHIDVSFQFHQEKLAKISSDLCGALAKTTVPFIVVEHPDPLLERKQFFRFNHLEYESGFQKNGNKLYQYANPKNKDTARLVKNLEKQFQKITRLNNSAHLKISLYNPLREERPQDRLRMLNGLKVKGSLSTDSDFVATFTEIIRRISHQFLNSPPMALIELLQQMRFKLELSPIQQFPAELREWLVGILNWSEWFNGQSISQLGKVKGDLVISITLPRLMSVKVKGEAAVFAAYASIFN